MVDIAFPAGYYNRVVRPASPALPGFQPGVPIPAAQVQALVFQLGSRTIIGRDGIVRFNQPLIRAIVSYRELAVPALGRFMAQAQTVPQIIEGLYTAEELAENGVQGVIQLYSLASRWNRHPNPLVQIYLAGFYRNIPQPAAFGPMLTTLIQHAMTTNAATPGPFRIDEEVGGTVLQKIADRTADETVRRLLPYLRSSPPAVAPYPGSAPLDYPLRPMS